MKSALHSGALVASLFLQMFVIAEWTKLTQSMQNMEWMKIETR
jgi:hypothetical protein